MFVSTRLSLVIRGLMFFWVHRGVFVEFRPGASLNTGNGEKVSSPGHGSSTHRQWLNWLVGTAMLPFRFVCLGYFVGRPVFFAGKIHEQVAPKRLDVVEWVHPTNHQHGDMGPWDFCFALEGFVKEGACSPNTLLDWWNGRQNGAKCHPKVVTRNPRILGVSQPRTFGKYHKNPRRTSRKKLAQHDADTKDVWQSCCPELRLPNLLGV